VTLPLRIPNQPSYAENVVTRVRYWDLPWTGPRQHPQTQFNTVEESILPGELQLCPEWVHRTRWKSTHPPPSLHGPKGDVLDRRFFINSTMGRGSLVPAIRDFRHLSSVTAQSSCSGQDRWQLRAHVTAEHHHRPVELSFRFGSPRSLRSSVLTAHDHYPTAVFFFFSSLFPFRLPVFVLLTEPRYRPFASR